MNRHDNHIEVLYKEKFGQLIALIVRRFPALSLESAEDIVQESFAEATTRWPVQGVPANAAGWLYQACKNKAINLVKSASKTEDLSAAGMLSHESGEISDEVFSDAQLQMLIACCHPNIPPKTQVVLALKYVANFKVENIALQLGIGQDAVEKMLYRTREKIKGDELVLSVRPDSYSRERLAVVHKVIYLIFHEGYKQSGDKIGQGKVLCEDALILNKFLFDSSVCNSETKALQALMLFNAARFDGRFDKNGDAIELEHQDRSLWDAALIKLAHKLLIESEDPIFSPYHLEAAIAFVHCTALKFENTDWKAICRYYEALLKIYPSPFAEINYAVALQYDHQDEKAFRILMDLHQNPYYTRLPILNKSLQKYFERMGIRHEGI